MKRYRHPLVSLVEDTTGFRVLWDDTSWVDLVWHAATQKLVVGYLEAKKEVLLHEFCHWVVATPTERQQHNLGMSGFLSEFEVDTREWAACALETYWARVTHCRLRYPIGVVPVTERLKSLRAQWPKLAQRANLDAEAARGRLPAGVEDSLAVALRARDAWVALPSAVTSR